MILDGSDDKPISGGESPVDRLVNTLRLGRVLPRVLTAELKGQGYKDIDEKSVEVFLELVGGARDAESIAARGEFDRVQVVEILETLRVRGYISWTGDKPGAHHLSLTDRGQTLQRVLTKLVTVTQRRPLLWLMSAHPTQTGKARRDYLAA